MPQTTESNGKSLVIVESPAKARTISKFLGSNFTVEASIGHVRDLPKNSKEVPEKYRSQKWAKLGVNVEEENFEPLYIVPEDKKAQVSKLKKLLKECKDLYLATDEDREGEAISWHLRELLDPKVPVHRLVFHEITKTAIQDALSHPRHIDDALVRAQETRRILDRLYGYEVSPLLWYKVGPKLSAGRVQSVAIRLIVDRERERQAFVTATYWDLSGTFSTVASDVQSSDQIEAVLVSVDGRRLPTGKDFDAATGQLTDGSLLLLGEAEAGALIERLRGAEFAVSKLEDKPYSSGPRAPFTTSTLQQEANNRLGFSAKRTMDVAQSLYENGYITYMRTDSTNLAKEAVEAARDLVRSQYGAEYLPAEPRVYVSKVKNAQEAHEAIRPAGPPFRMPESLRSELNHDQYRLYDLIWKRTIASQMVNARGVTRTITIGGEGAEFRVSGTTIEFPGYMRVDPDSAKKEKLLPAVAVDDPVRCIALDGNSHTTQPPARYTEATLTRTLEEKGIGRPSTYASIIETILRREYVFKRGKALVPTWTAFAVVRLLEQHLPQLVDYEFTAEMENYLDAISRQEAEHLAYLRKFYFGDDTPGLKRQVDEKREAVDAREVCSFPLGQRSEDEPEVVVRVGRYGPFLQQGERRASIPDGMPPDELNLDKALELLDQGQQDDEPLGLCPDTQRPVYVKQGRFGPYVQLGTTAEDQKPVNASLLRGMEPTSLTLDVALQLLALPRTLGEHPSDGQPVVASNGRYGPYIKWNNETRSLPAELSPIDVSLDQALELLAQPKTRGRGRSAPKEPLKTFEPSPVTGEPIRLLDGRYGPYVTDGETNASLPRDTSADSLTLEQAIHLLAERAARAPAKKKKKATKKKATTKATGKGATKKKAARKKAAKKAARKKATE